MTMKMMIALLAVLLTGCAASLGSQGTRWEHWCFDVDGVPAVKDLENAGNEGWELVSASFRPPVVQNGSSVGGGATYVCFKRPKK